MSLRLDCPPGLPIADHLDEIRDALRDHRVIVVAGETGSGKTTQLPKAVLELWPEGRIAHTQPRRIAARAVAERIAEEIGVSLGGLVGYRVRFDDRAGADTALTVMTDGLLLAQVREDRMLRRYDTIIVDEAHERSLSIDFLLGYLAWLLPRRPDLRVIITSATLDTERIAAHFAEALSIDDIPVIEVSGRTFPVETRYRPPADDVDEVQAICEAVDELLDEGPGDVLVFCSGEREVRDAVDALGDSCPPGTEILPLYGRLSSAEQHRVFSPHDQRRIVVSTNVAETSLTVPGIHYVVDTGTARISRFSHRLKVQRLPIEPISRASAQQRAGRCGRIADGICIRLYAESDLDRRSEFTEPEILRTNLASVLLQMATLGLGEVADFPFIDPPDPRNVAAGLALLEEIGALRPAGRDDPLAERVTDIGRRLARIPLDPRLGRMVIAGTEERCLDDVIVVAAGLTIRDPRERPEDREQAADAAHARFDDPASDLMTLLALWDHLQAAQRSMSSSAFRRLCREEFLNYLRVREWQDLVHQVSDAIRHSPEPSPMRDPDALHRAVLSGLLSHIGRLEPRDKDTAPRTRRRGREYLGARGGRFALWPGSALARAARRADDRQRGLPEWVMAAELVETTRLWGRMAARIDPAWIEPLAGDLVARSHSDPLWSQRAGSAVCTERVTLYGVPIVDGRRIPYDRIDPATARDMFIRHALVLGEWRHDHEPLRRNQELLDSLREREDRARMREVALDLDAVVAFYDARIPANVTSGRRFDAWWRRERRTSPELLDLPLDLVADPRLLPREDDFPSAWPPIPEVDADLEVTYRFDPVDPRDGVTVRVPVALLPALPPDAFALQVPGLREDLLVALLRGLPKDLRREVGPAPDAAAAVLAHLATHPSPVWPPTNREKGRENAAGRRPTGGTPPPVRERLSAAVRAARGVVVPPSDWSWDRVPAHLVPTVVVVDERGREIAAGKDLPALRDHLGDRATAEVSAAVPELAGTAVTAWPDLPDALTVERRGYRVTAYPTLVAADDGTARVEILPTPEDRDRAMPHGIVRLLCATVPLKVSTLPLDSAEKLVLSRNPQGSVAGLLEEAREVAALGLLEDLGGLPTSAEEFEAAVHAFRREQQGRVTTLLREVAPVLEEWWAVTTALAEPAGPRCDLAIADLRAQVQRLVHPGFLREYGAQRLPDLARYLTAARRRREKLPMDPGRDLLRLEQVQRVTQAASAVPPGPAADALRWSIEELRVSLWAQEIGTREKVSEQRIMRAIREATAH